MLSLALLLKTATRFWDQQSKASETLLASLPSPECAFVCVFTGSHGPTEKKVDAVLFLYIHLLNSWWPVVIFGVG